MAQIEGLQYIVTTITQHCNPFYKDPRKVPLIVGNPQACFFIAPNLQKPFNPLSPLQPYVIMNIPTTIEWFPVGRY